MVAAAPAKTRAARTSRTKLSIQANGRHVLDASGITRLDRELARLRFKYGVAIEGVAADKEFTAVLTKDYVYLQLPGNPIWGRVSMNGGDPTFSTGVSESLQYLSAVTGNVRPAGTVSIRGGRARLYSATVDLDEVANNLPADERDSYRKKILKERLPHRLPLKVAIDEKGRIARMDYRTRLQGIDVEAHFELYDFGAKGDLSPPKHFING